MRAFRHMLFVLVAAWSVVFLPAKAHAEDVYCLGNGEVGGGYFFNQSSGSGSACTLTGLDHVFSQVICSFVRILNQVLTKVYCGVQFAMIDTLSILLSVYVMIFGVQLLMGMTQLNSREIMVRLLKIAGVWMFATESQWAIGLAFNFFIDLGSSGIYWALGSIPIADLNTTCISTTNLDNLRSVMPVYAFLDRLLYCAVLAPISSAHIGILGFFLAMSIVVPPIFMLAVYWFWTVISVLMRAIISFLMGISAVAFLITLSPIFLSMMLFRATYQYFENWLRYIISYSLQIVIVFACIALWLTTVPLIIGFFSELSSVVFDASRAHSTAQVSDTTRSWGICPYKIENRPGSLAPRIRCDKIGFNPVLDPDSPEYIAALNDPDPRVFESLAESRASDKQQLIPLARLAQNQNGEEITGSVCTPSGCNFVGGNRVLGDLVYYVIYHLISLIIISYAFNALLQASPQIATQLAGPEYMFTVGQGFGTSGLGSTGKGVTQRLKMQRDNSGNSIFSGKTWRDMGINVRDATGQFVNNTSDQVTRRGR